MESTQLLIIVVSGIALFLLYYFDPLGKLFKLFTIDPDKGFRLIAIIFILGFAVVGGVVSALKVFTIIQNSAQ